MRLICTRKLFRPSTYLPIDPPSRCFVYVPGNYWHRQYLGRTARCQLLLQACVNIEWDASVSACGCGQSRRIPALSLCWFDNIFIILRPSKASLARCQGRSYSLLRCGYVFFYEFAMWLILAMWLWFFFLDMALATGDDSSAVICDGFYLFPCTVRW